MAHVLNLDVAGSTVNYVQVENLFGLVEETAFFISQSYKKMSVWENTQKAVLKVKKNYTDFKKVVLLDGRASTRRLFQYITMNLLKMILIVPTNAKNLFELVNLFHVLLNISKGNFDCKIKFTAPTLLNQWTKTNQKQRLKTVKYKWRWIFLKKESAQK